MKKSAQSSQELHPLIQERWSPRAFDENYVISDADIDAILEAGRWSPSSMNFQPWRFIVATRGAENFELVTRSLTGFNLEWAPRASLYIVLAGSMYDDAGKLRNQSLYDVGIASAYMTIEANHRNLAVHQVGGFDRSKIHSSFHLPEAIQAIAILVIGRQASADTIANSDLKVREAAARSRRPLSDLVISDDRHQNDRRS